MTKKKSVEIQKPARATSSSFVRDGESVEFTGDAGSRIAVPLDALLMLAQKALGVINATGLQRYSAWLQRSGQVVDDFEVTSLPSADGERMSLVLQAGSGLKVSYSLSLTQARDLGEALLERVIFGCAKEVAGDVTAIDSSQPDADGLLDPAVSTARRNRRGLRVVSERPSCAEAD